MCMDQKYLLLYRPGMLDASQHGRYDKFFGLVNQMEPLMPRTCVAALLLSLSLTATLRAESYRRVDGRDCAILDMPLTTGGGFTLNYVLPADTTAPAWEELSAAELSAWNRFVYWETDFGADVDLQGLWDTTLLNIQGTEDDAYPLTMARLRLQWTQRYEANYGFEMDASPGLYSSFESLESADFAVPFGGRWVLPISPDFSIYAGANIYPTFDHVIDPRLGLRLAHRDNVIVDLGYPESRIILSPGPRFTLTAGARVSLWPEYNMGDDPRERLRVQEFRLYGQLDIGITDYTHLSLNGGSLLQREIAFKSEADDVEIDDALFAGISLTRML